MAIAGDVNKLLDHLLSEATIVLDSFTLPIKQKRNISPSDRVSLLISRLSHFAELHNTFFVKAQFIINSVSYEGGYSSSNYDNKFDHVLGGLEFVSLAVENLSAVRLKMQVKIDKQQQCINQNLMLDRERGAIIISLVTEMVFQWTFYYLIWYQ